MASRRRPSTIPEAVDGRFTGRVEGVPCYGAGKVTRVEAWLRETGRSLEESWFYSDSFTDVPLLEVVEQHVVGFVADRVHRQLQVGLVGAEHEAQELALDKVSVVGERNRRAEDAVGLVGIADLSLHVRPVRGLPGLAHPRDRFENHA